MYVIYTDGIINKSNEKSPQSQYEPNIPLYKY